MTKRSSKPRTTKESEKSPQPQQALAPVKKHKRSLSLEEWLSEIRDHALAAARAGEPTGACLVPNSQTGGNDCVITDEATCTNRLKGAWIGGPCGPG